MEHISLGLGDLMNKIKGFYSSEELLQKQIVEIINEVCSEEIKPQQIKYQKGNLIILGDRYLKSKIFLFQQEIVFRLEKDILKDRKILKIN